MKRIIIELLKDEKSEEYTILSDNVLGDRNGSVICQGEDILDALTNFTNAIHDIEQYKKDK